MKMVYPSLLTRNVTSRLTIIWKYVKGVKSEMELNTLALCMHQAMTTYLSLDKYYFTLDAFREVRGKYSMSTRNSIVRGKAKRTLFCAQNEGHLAQTRRATQVAFCAQNR